MDVRRRAAFAVAAVIIVAGIVMKSQRNVETATRNGTVIATGTTGSGSVAPPPRPAPDATPTFAVRILADYGDAARTAEEDMRAVARTLDNFSLLVKGDNPLPLGANEEIAAALRGKNKAGLRALPGDHRIFDARGRLIDRWGTPLYFHAQSRDRLEIRSAGPDRQMWTADDLHRKHDGRFLRGEELLAPSLFDEKSAAR